MTVLREKAKLMSSEDLNRVIKRIAHEMVEQNKGTENMILVGIHRRGVYLARRLQKIIEEVEGTKIPCGELDITLYRDDLTMLFEQPMVHSTRMPQDISGKNIYLVDDVLYTGRTVRAAPGGTCRSRASLISEARRNNRQRPQGASYTRRYVRQERADIKE